MMQFFPEIAAYNSGFLKVSELHSIYYDEAGNSGGKSILHIHGGPGGESKSKYRCFYNPEKYRIILYDQRGCGKSTPNGELKENTTQELVEDIEKLRKHLKIDKWVINGGSWGSTLALAYSEKYTAKVEALILRGVFMLTKSELNWLCNGEGIKNIYPDIFEKYTDIVPIDNRNNILQYYYKIMVGDDINLQKQVTLNYQTWEEKIQKLIIDPDEQINDINTITQKQIANTRIAFHYFVNNGFLFEDELFEKIDLIRNIPAVIINGRYDMVTPLNTAWKLHKLWPEADFHIINDAGHHPSEKGIKDKIMEYAAKFSNL